MTELQPLRRGAKMRVACKNDPNLSITLPNFNSFIRKIGIIYV